MKKKRSTSEKILSALISQEYFATEWEMFGGFLDLSPKKISKEWDVDLETAKKIKKEAKKIFKEYKANVEVSINSLKKIEEMNTKYWR